MRDSKQFAVDNAGKRFKFRGRIVTVVGYKINKVNAEYNYVLVSHRSLGWTGSMGTFNADIVLTTSPKDKTFWYVFPEELKPL